jgi:hypothetical protein
MLTETVPLDDQGQPINGHVSGAWIGAYFFEQGTDGWTLAKRSDGVDYLGFMGNIGQTKVERIAPQRFVLTTTSGSCWQGNCGTWFSVYELVWAPCTNWSRAFRCRQRTAAPTKPANRC